MKVGYCIRSDAFTRPGGDTVQAQKTAAALKQFGVKIEWMSNGNGPRCDLYHLFNLTRVTDTYRWAQRAKQIGIPYVLSPIWHSLRDMRLFYGDYFGGGMAFPIKAYLAFKELYYERKQIDRYALTSSLRWISVQKSIVSDAKIVVPNCPEEYDTLLTDLAIRKGVCRVVPNAVDLDVCYKNTEARENRIVCAGRIEPRKNTLKVIQAFLDSQQFSEWQLCLVGRINESHRRYADKVLQKVDGQRVVHLGQLPFNEVQKIFSQSRAVILGSYFETTGLVGLEALYQGTPVVMTERSYNLYYYGDHVTYCDPYDVASIRMALEQCILQPRPLVNEQYFQKFSWESAAQATMEAYDLAVD